MCREKILMTGVTGVYGRAIFQELEKIFDVYYLVRDGVNNRRLPLEINSDRVFSADITQNLCNLQLADLKQLEGLGISKVLHAAANVSFQVDDRDGDIYRTNYVGTSNTIQLAKHIGVIEFIYCSTAFVKYKRNPYEKSKIAAEELVEQSDLKYSILRLSSIVGDSKTGWTPGFNGYYGAFAYLRTLAKRFADNFSIYVVCGKESTLNLISLDWTTYITVELMKRSACNNVYYLAHNEPRTARWILEKTFEILHVDGINYLTSEELKNGSVYSIYNDYVISLHDGNPQTARVQKVANMILERYHPYVVLEEKFHHDSLIADLGDDYITPPLIDSSFLSTILAYAVEKNFGYNNVKS